MASTGPTTTVESPEIVPPVIGLLASVVPVVDQDERWGNGVKFLPDGCGGDVEVVPICDPPTLETPERHDQIEIQPFDVIAPYNCSAMATNLEEYVQKARRKLIACQSAKIAREFWLGSMVPENVHLDSTESRDISGASDNDDPVEALAQLEGALANCGCGGRAMIHGTWLMATILHARNAIRRVDDAGGRTSPRLETAVGNIFVADSGYPGTGPNGSVTSGIEWMYGTSMVKVYLGSIQDLPGDISNRPFQAVNRSINDVTVYAQRPAMVVVDPCCFIAQSAAVPVTPVGS